MNLVADESVDFPIITALRTEGHDVLAVVELAPGIDNEIVRQAARTPHEQSVLAVQIATTDRQIDRLGYALYGLTEDEVQIVEGG
jgi:hypothetical protein